MSTSSKSKSKTAAAVRKLQGETNAARKKATKAKKDYNVVSAPHVASNAEVIGTKTVKNARVVKGKATYRGAEIEGTFLLAPDSEPVEWANGTLRAAVDVKWFDWNPTRGYLNFAFPKRGYQVKEKYNGKVVARIGRKEA